MSEFLLSIDQQLWYWREVKHVFFFSSNFRLVTWGNPCFFTVQWEVYRWDIENSGDLFECHGATGGCNSPLVGSAQVCQPLHPSRVGSKEVLSASQKKIKEETSRFECHNVGCLCCSCFFFLGGTWCWSLWVWTHWAVGRVGVLP